MPVALYSSVLLMGFLGSMHCGVMCGPLSCNFKNNQQFMSYHLGRLVSYLLVVAFLYTTSSYLLNSESRNLKIFFSIFFSICFIFFGLMQLQVFKMPKLSFKFYKIQFAIMNKNRVIIDRFPIVLGLMTGLFPCSWLYSFLLFSTQLKNSTDAFVAIVLFWLSSLPAFFLFSSVLQRLIKNSPFNYQRISGIMLIVAGLFSVFGHWTDVFSSLL